MADGPSIDRQGGADDGLLNAEGIHQGIDYRSNVPFRGRVKG